MKKKTAFVFGSVVAVLAGVGIYKYLRIRQGNEPFQAKEANIHQKWTADDIPDLTEKVMIVTGANSGIGLETAREFARHGAHTIMACRSLNKAQTALNQIQAEIPNAPVEVMELDLADLNSVQQFVESFKAKYDRLDVLVNNAGIMMPPYSKTMQGFETQFGVNHLGHFALTGLLLNLLLETPHSRVVTVSSGVHRFGQIDFDDLQWERKAYNSQRAYGQSKLANLLFTYELQRRLSAAGQDTIAVAAHPGWTATNLQQHSTLYSFFNPLFAQSPAMGALPTIRAAVDPRVQGSQYFGPGGFMEIRGYPVPVESNDASHNLTVARQLWEVSTQLTGVSFAELRVSQGLEA